MSAASFGLDSESALKRLAGNTKLYTKLLTQFRASYAGAADELRSQVAAGDMSAAERTSHTIKGLAGTLGANALQSVSAKLESLCREAADGAAINSEIEVFSKELANAMEDVDVFLAGQTSAAPQAAARTEIDQNQLAAFMVLLEDDDAEANALYKDLRPAIAQRHPGIVSALDRSIDGFDYTQALSLLRTVFRL